MHPSRELFMLPPSESIMFQSALEAIELPAWCCDIPSQLVRMNYEYRQLTSTACSTMPLSGLLTHFHPDESVRLRLLNTNRPREQIAQLNTFRMRELGEFHQFKTLTIWSFTPNGKSVGNLNVIFPENSSARNTSPSPLNSSQLIIGELQHRLRNILMVVSSLAENTARTSDSLNDFLSSFSGKLKALICSHVQVCSDRQSAMLFSELASNEIGHILSEPSLVSINSPVIYIRKELIPIFQLILYELTTNSLKYGAAKSLRGSITLSCSHSVNSLMEPVVEFHWREHWKATNGINGTSDSKHAPGLNSGGNGMRLLKTLITKYFKGTFNWALDPQSLDVRWDLSQQTLAPRMK